MNTIFSHTTTSKLDPSVGAMTAGSEHFLESRAANPGFFLPIEDTPQMESLPAIVQIGLEQLSYGGSLSPLVQITLLSCAEDLKKMSTD